MAAHDRIRLIACPSINNIIYLIINMKKPDLFFSSILVPLDYIMIVLAAISAYQLRFSDTTRDIRPIIFELPFENYFYLVLVIAATWILVFTFSGLYSFRRPANVAKELARVILACSTGLALIAIFIFFRRELFDSRFIVIATWLFAIIYISLGRLFVRWLKRYLLRFGLGVRHLVLVGSSKTTEKLIAEFAAKPNLGYQVVRRLRDFSLDSVAELTELMKLKELMK